MRRTILIAAYVVWSQVAHAQSTTNVVKMEPVEIDTIGCDFESWTLTAAGEATVSRVGIPANSTDTPSGVIIGGPTLQGNVVTVQLSPDAGCGTTGCRNGNSYQVRLRAEAGTDRPTCNIKLDVKKVTFTQ